MDNQQPSVRSPRDILNVWILAFAGVSLVLPLIWFSWVVAGRDEVFFVFNITILLVGLALGWVFGVLISPLPGEQDQFQQYAKAVAIFSSGYLLAKVDPIITEILNPKQIFALLPAFRLLSFIVCFIASMLFAFGWRRYFYGKDDQRNQ